MQQNPRKYPKEVKQKKVVTEDAFGFCDSGSSEGEGDQEEEMKEAGPQDQSESDEDEIADQMEALNKIMKRQETPQKQQASQKSIISSNKYVKSDLDELEKLCDGLSKENRRREDEERDQRSAKRNQAR